MCVNVCVRVDFNGVVMACCIYWTCSRIEFKFLVGTLTVWLMFGSYMSYVEQVLIYTAWSICVTSCRV